MVKILLAEDDQFIRDIYTEILQDEKYDVVTAADGREALNKIKQGGWDIVLLDILMPKMTGLEILQKLKSFKKNSLAKHILVMTNNEETSDLEDVKDMYDDYVLKSSLTPGELLEKIKHVLKD